MKSIHRIISDQVELLKAEKEILLVEQKKIPVRSHSIFRHVIAGINFAIKNLEVVLEKLNEELTEMEIQHQIGNSEKSIKESRHLLK